MRSPGSIPTEGNILSLARINIALLHKEPKVSVLQANVKLVQKGLCWTWNQRPREAQLLFPLEVTFYHWIFCFQAVKTKMPILAFLYSL